MKRITAKIFASFMLAFSIVFAGLSITSSLTATPAYALPEESGPNAETTLDDPTLNPPSEDETTTPDETNPDNPSENTSDDQTDPNETPIDGNTEDETVNEETTETTPPTEESANVCTDQAGALSWIVCPTTQLIAGIVDTIYALINDLLVVQPISMSDSSPIYIIWQYVLNLTNTVFIIFLLIVIFSQVTGVGISNYGIKRALPRLIIAVILMNLSFHICALAVDVSNIIGNSLREFFGTIQNDMLAAVSGTVDIRGLSFDSLLAVLLGGTSAAAIAIGATGGLGALFWMLVPVLIGAVVAVVTGLITIAARQAVVALLIMISPLAFVTYLLPNTERWFAQWKNLLVRMLIFYPAFSFLYGASQLVGWAIIAAASNGFGVILGLAVQVFPLFFSWSLMKMSGTILGTFNETMRRIAKPVQGLSTRWATEHAEQRRQNFIAQNDNSSGARLRQYLDYRRTLRLNDTKNAAEIRQDRAIERAMTTSASVLGRDAKGNMKWSVNPNRYTRTAKSASYHHTLASNANAIYQNTLSGYGRHFTDDQANRLSYDHAEAFADSMAQQFLAANEAEADQKWLLDQYLDAKTNLKVNAYQYNRLIKDAAGGLGHNGESSIMGQVIIGNSNIENRRRAEARVMINKFGMEKHKQQLRGMVFDKQYINDDGFATNERGELIEDDQYNLLSGKQYTPWQSYIGVHKLTGKEITKEQFDALSEDERKAWTKVRYFDITNDDKKDVQRVFEDDAGYMKEILADDIAIADPINRRYLVEIGVAKKPDEKNGMVRRYHSTVRTALDSTGFKDHAAGVTAMLTSSANFGNLREIGHYNVGLLQSLAVAAKPGSFLKNDKFFIKEINNLVQAFSDSEKFAHYFPDSAVNSATNNNGIPIDGLEEIEENGKKIWKKVNHQDVAELEKTDPAKALELRKNFIKHNYMARAFSSVVGFLNREMTPDSLASLKPGALPAMKELLESLSKIGVKSLDPKTAFADRINGDLNIFGAPDGRDLRLGVQETQDEIERLYGIISNPQRQGNNIQTNGNNGSSSSSRSHRRSSNSSSPYGGLDEMLAMLEREREYRQRNSAERVISLIQEAFANARNARSLSILISDLTSYFSEIECLREETIYRQFTEIIQKYQSMPHPTEDTKIGQITDPYETFEKAIIDAMEPEIMDLINSANLQ